MVLAATIGALGSLGSAGFGVLSANAQSGKAFARQKELMEHQAALNYHYAEQSALNSPSWNRKGLETAGYNPMLAVQNATSGANTSWTSSQTAPQDQATDAITNGISNGTEFANMINNTKQTESNVDLNEAQSRKVTSEAINNEIHSKYLPQREEKELGMIGAQTDKLIRETSFLDQVAENMEVQRRLQEMGINADYLARIYGADKLFAGTVYNADTNERNNIRSNRNNRNKVGGPLGLYGNRGILNSSMESYYDYLPKK